MNEYWNDTDEKTRVISEPIPFPLCAPKIPHVGLGLNMGLHDKELVPNCLTLAQSLTWLWFNLGSSSESVCGAKKE